MIKNCLRLDAHLKCGFTCSGKQLHLGFGLELCDHNVFVICDKYLYAVICNLLNDK